MRRMSVDRRKQWRLLVLVLGLLVFQAAPLLASGDAGHGEAEAKGGVATDTQRVLNFVVLAGGLYFLLRKPASKALKARIEEIEKQLKDLEARKQAAEKELAAYNEKIARLDQEAGQIAAEYERQGKEARARIIEEAKVAAQKLEEQAKRNIEFEMKSARERLQAEVIEKALQKAESRLKERMTAEDQDRLIDEYLAKVVAS